MDPVTIALLTSAAIKAGSGMYSKHKQGQAMEKAQETQEDEQRRLDAIAQLQRRPSQQAALKYKMPKSAKVADVVGQLAGLGGQVAMMKGGGGGGSMAAGGQGLSGGVVDPNTLMKPANAYTSGFGQRRAIDTWQPSYLR
jgi:hypothetical protein|tara:strand:+ start:561 stop:980 length:420 start_codon:yes stop_codon:yes gene_type:complete